MADTSSLAADQQQPRPLAVAKPPSSCRLCNLELSSPEDFRAHLKSDKHVQNLQAKVAEPGSDSDTPALSPSANGANTTQKPKKGTRKPKYETQVESELKVDAESELSDSKDEDVGEDASISTPDFSSSECLFCPHDSSISNANSTEESVGSLLEANLSHMSSSHGFIIPFQDCLAPDVTLDIIVEYLHFIIQGYRECISCDTRRSTVEGVQQHMIAKGHCRFDISPETEEFYEMPQLATANITDQDNKNPTRLLPSGKLILSRQSLDPAGDAAAHDDPRRVARREKAAAAREKKEEAEALSPIASLTAPKTVPTPGFRTQRGATTAQSASTEMAVTTRKGPSGEIIHQRSSEAILATQLSRLRIASDRAQRREELRRRGRLESAGNEVLRHHFRVSAGDSRFGKGFC